ncbi:MAG: outer membrane lipoprotein carrier protein LolA [Nonlabens sp.]|nr:outer membrane lipoprotein carrier protein LolA [Nonlabens sp.]
MRTLIAGIFMFFAFAKAIPAQAQSSKADALLKEVTAKYKSYNNLTFNYKANLRNDKAKQNMDIQGDAILSGEKYHVTFMGSTLIYDGSKLYNINSEDEQVTISSQSKNDMGISPSNILTFYEKGYTRSWDIEQNVRGRKVQYVKLVPIKSDSDYKQVLLGIDTNTKHIYNAIITERSGTVITFTMSSLKTNTTIPKSSFSFNSKDYDGWDIERL